MSAPMPELSFRYRGAHADGRLERGRVVAASRKDAQRILLDRGMHPFDVVQEKTSTWRGSSIPVADLARANDAGAYGSPRCRLLGRRKQLLHDKWGPRWRLRIQERRCGL